MADDGGFRRALAWSVAALAVVGVVVILIITLVPQTSTEKVSMAGPAPKHSDAKRHYPVGTAEPSKSARQTSIGQAVADSTSDPVARANPADRAIPVDAAASAPKQQPESPVRDAGDRATPHSTTEPATRHSETNPTKSWIAQDVVSRVGPFLSGGLSGIWFRPAPPDQRFVVVRASILWDGAADRQLALRPADIGHSRLWLRVDQRRVYSVGRLPATPHPLRSLSLDMISFTPGEPVNAAFAFLVPNEARHARLEVEGRLLAHLHFAAPATFEVGDLLGSWRRVPSQRTPLRFADPLANRIADPGCQSLRIVKDRGGSVRLMIPCAQSESEPLASTDVADGFAVVFHVGAEAHDAYLRVVTRNPPKVLLYVAGPEHGGGFLYERESW